MLEKFEELNPDIDVVMDYSDWDGYWTKLPAQVAGSQTPDVFQMDYAKLAEYVENGVTADLSSYIADGSLDMSNVEQNILDSGTVDGKVYAISTGTNAPVMLYRKDILDELGLSLPMNPTMSEYIEISKNYCSPKSSGFINGVLDKTVALLKEKNEIRKVGRGLME